MTAFSKASEGRGLVMAGLLTLPGIAHAQHIPTWLALAVLSPLLVIALATGLGFLSGSWRAGGRHVALIVLWLVLSGIFAYWVENDYIIRIPLLVYALHALIIVFLVILQVASRIRGAARSAGGRDGG